MRETHRRATEHAGRPYGSVRVTYERRVRTSPSNLNFLELRHGEVRRIYLLERFAMILGCTASWGNERVLVGPEKEDRRGQGTGHAHRRSRPLLRRGHLHRQALRSRGPQREAARSEEAPRLQAEAGRRSKQAPGSGSRRASGGHPLPKALVLAESGRGFGQ